nr:hypothetical protein [Tanacetum cinerariifolium]
IEESLRARESDKGKGKEVGGPFVNMIKEEAFYVQVDAIAWWIDSGAITHVCKDCCWFKTYEHVEDGSILYIGDDHFAPVHGIIYETTTPYTPQQNGMAERKNRPLKKMVTSMLSYSGLNEGFWEKPFEGSRDQVGSQYSYCYSIKEDPRNYDEAMQYRDAAFWKEAVDDEIDLLWKIIHGSYLISTRLLLALAAIHNQVIHQMDVKTTFLNGDLDEEVYMKQPEGFIMPGNEHKVIDQNQVDKTKKFLSSRFSMKDMGEADIILEKINPNTSKPLDQLEYSRAIGCLMYVMTSTRPDIAYAVGRLSRFTIYSEFVPY